MGKLPLSLLTTVLSFLFIFLGTSKLSAYVNDDFHREMKKSFVEYVKVFPLYKRLGWKPTAANYRTTVGVLEITSALALMFLPGRFQNIANKILLLITCGALYNHISLRHPVETMLPALGVGILLVLRYMLQSRDSNHPPQKIHQASNLPDDSSQKVDEKID